MRVLLGNPAAKEAFHDADGTLRHRPVDGARVMTVTIPDSYTLLEAVAAVAAADGMWNNHSQGNAVTDTKPDWVESDSEPLAMLLSAQLDCPVGRPKKWKGLD
jgi:hypothetical protein